MSDGNSNLRITRKDGYYWVRLKGDQHYSVAEYMMGRWFFCGNITGFNDSDMKEIDEIPLVVPVRKVKH